MFESRKIAIYYPEIFFVFLFLVMNNIGLVGYWMGLSYYTPPSGAALAFIAVANATVFAGWLMFFLYCNLSVRCGYSTPVCPKGIVVRASSFIGLSSWGIILIISLYVALFKESFVLYKLITGAAVGESDRPDVVGSVPFYWSFSVLLNSLAIPLTINWLVSAWKIHSPAKMKVVALIVILILLSLLLGSKSALLAIAFYFFFVLRENSIKVLSILKFGVLFVSFYTLVKWGYSPKSSLADLFSYKYLVESIFRRVCMINVSTMGVVIDSLILPGLEVPENFTHIKQYVFYQMYGYLPGGAPVPFAVHIVYSLGVGFISLMLIPFLVFFIFLARQVILAMTRPEAYIANHYLMFYSAIVLVSGSIFDFFVRGIAPAVLVMLISRIVWRSYPQSGGEDVLSARIPSHSFRLPNESKG